MIFDQIKNKDLYVQAHPLFEKAFDFLESYLKNTLESGEYEICGEDFTPLEYDAEGDFLFLEGGKQKLDFVLSEGEFVIFFRMMHISHP